MTKAEKVEFFVHCQKLLMEHHPDSSFVCRQDNIKNRLQQIRAFLDNYKGICYQDEFVCTLYNRIIVNNPDDPALDVRQYMYKESDPNYNAIVIDFAAFRDIKDCLPFVKANYDPKVQYVLFVRHNKVKMYPVVDFVSQLFEMPVI